MATRLGLDIGTNSIGWCLYDGDAIRDIGVRIFGTSPQGAGRDPKSGASLAVDRRDARAMRRRRDRYLGRRSALVDVLVAHGLLPQDRRAAKDLHGEDPYALRVRALDEKLTPHQIGRALFHLNQRRGFKSNRKADRVSKDNEDGKIASGTKALDQAIAESGARTLGEFLHNRDPLKGETKRVRMRPDADGYDFYPDRRHYEYEFEQIWAAQAAHHPGLLTDEAKAAIQRVIFFQRPLKAQVVGKCSFAGWYGIPDDEKRLPKAHPLFQQRRLYEEVNQLEVVSVGAPSRKLTLDERDKLVRLLQDHKKVNFAPRMRKLIKLKEGERFNKESENRKDLIGDEVRAEMMHKDRFGPDWTTFSTDKQWMIIERLLEEEDTEKLFAWLHSEHGLDRETAETVANAHLPDGHGRFGLTATTALLEQLKADVVTYAKAAENAGYHHSDHRTGECHETLPYYGEVLAREIAPGKEEYGDELERQWGKITNPTVHIGLNQLRKLVNAIVRQYGRPDEIVVELARDLKLNEKEKDKIKRRQLTETRDAERRNKLLRDLGKAETGGNRLRLQLWEELSTENALDCCCPFCARPIPINKLFSEEVEIEHIIPFSISLDDSKANKTVSHRKCNRDKRNMTPWQAFSHDEDRWAKITDQVSRMARNKQWRFGPDALDRFEDEREFLARQLTDTQYLSRLAGKYLSSLYPKRAADRLPGEGVQGVYVIPGRMTAMLRRKWGLNIGVLDDHNIVANPHLNHEKNRLDHRHHAIDAAVVGATDRGLLQEIAKLAGRSEDRDLDRLLDGVPVPWEGTRGKDAFRRELREKLYATTISFKPDHGRKGKPKKDRDITSGRLHNDTAYGLTGRTNAKGVPIVVTRKPLLSLKPGDLIDPERMPDHDLQDALFKATRGTSGKEFEKALREFAKRDGPFKGIRRVRLTEPLNVIPIRDKDGRAYKAVKGDANARFDVWRLSNGKWVTKWKDREGNEQSSIISMFDAHQRDFAEARPHPAAKKVLSLRQNDLLAVERDGGEREIMRVVKFSSIGTMQLAPHNEAGALKARDADGGDPFKYVNTSGGGLKNIKARQIRIDELGHIHDPGPRD